jgi:hypothetical protein
METKNTKNLVTLYYVNGRYEKKDLPSLEALRDFIKNHYAQIKARENAWFSEPSFLPEIDWLALPSFGGQMPFDTTGIWSWDEKNLLIGDCTMDLKIVSREEWGPK